MWAESQGSVYSLRASLTFQASCICVLATNSFAAYGPGRLPLFPPIPLNLFLQRQQVPQFIVAGGKHNTNFY
jgi:hypothetical protein